MHPQWIDNDMFRRRPIPIWDDTKGYKKPTQVLVLLTSQVGFHLGVAGRRHIHRGLNITVLSFRDNENRNPLPIVSSLPFDLPSAGGPGCWWLPCPKKKNHLLETPEYIMTNQIMLFTRTTATMTSLDIWST